MATKYLTTQTVLTRISWIVIDICTRVHECGPGCGPIWEPYTPMAYSSDSYSGRILLACQGEHWTNSHTLAPIQVNTKVTNLLLCYQVSLYSALAKLSCSYKTIALLAEHMDASPNTLSTIAEPCQMQCSLTKAGVRLRMGHQHQQRTHTQVTHLDSQPIPAFLLAAKYVSKSSFSNLGECCPHAVLSEEIG